MYEGIKFINREKAAESFVNSLVGKRPVFILVIGTTETAKIPGITAAGKSVESVDKTPAADAEVLLLGRPRCINEVPKFGNDDEYVDSLAREVHIRTNAEFMKFKDYYGQPMMINGSVAGGYYGYSKACGATPDGRKDGEPVADALLSPASGKDKTGPTAVLKSAARVTPTYNHLLNQKFLPQFLDGENRKIFAQYLKAWADLGIYHVQFNVVDKATLLDARAHPEKYSDLVVRVAGYSAYWVDLDEGIQNEIIRRTEQSFA